MQNSTEILSEFNLDVWSKFLTKVVGNDPPWLQVMFITTLFLIFVVGLIGNLLTCFVIYNDRTMHTATNFYLFNLAISDLIVSFAILLELYEYICDSYQFGNIACKMHFFSVIALWNNSILVMTTLAIERYIAIWHPMLLEMTPMKKRVAKVIVALWIIAILETSPEIWTVELIKTNEVLVCYTVPTPFARVVNGVLALTTFVIPLGIMVFVYVMIALKVNDSVKSSSSGKIFNHKNNRGKVNKLIALTLSFLICWLPFFAFRVAIFICDLKQLTQLVYFWGIGYRIMLVNNWLSIVLNPILFSLMSTKFRKALKILWNSKIKGREEINPSQIIGT